GASPPSTIAVVESGKMSFISSLIAPASVYQTPPTVAAPKVISDGVSVASLPSEVSTSPASSSPSVASSSAPGSSAPSPSVSSPLPHAANANTNTKRADNNQILFNFILNPPVFNF